MVNRGGQRKKKKHDVDVDSKIDAKIEKWVVKEGRKSDR